MIVKWFKKLRQKRAKKERLKKEVDQFLNEADSFINPYMEWNGCTRDEATRVWVKRLHDRCTREMKIEKLFETLGI